MAATDYLAWNVTHAPSSDATPYAEVPSDFAATARSLDIGCDAILADGTVCGRTVHAGGHVTTNAGKSVGSALYAACAACNIDDNFASKEVGEAVRRLTAPGADARAAFITTAITGKGRKELAKSANIEPRGTGVVALPDLRGAVPA